MDLARDVRIQRTVALKTLNGLTDDEAGARQTPDSTALKVAMDREVMQRV